MLQNTRVELLDLCLTFSAKNWYVSTISTKIWYVLTFSTKFWYVSTFSTEFYLASTFLTQTKIVRLCLTQFRYVSIFSTTMRHVWTFSTVSIEIFRKFICSTPHGYFSTFSTKIDCCGLQFFGGGLFWADMFAQFPFYCLSKTWKKLNFGKK